MHSYSTSSLYSGRFKTRGSCCPVRFWSGGTPFSPSSNPMSTSSVFLFFLSLGSPWSSSLLDLVHPMMWVGENTLKSILFFVMLCRLDPRRDLCVDFYGWSHHPVLFVSLYSFRQARTGLLFLELQGRTMTFDPVPKFHRKEGCHGCPSTHLWSHKISFTPAEPTHGWRSRSRRLGLSTGTAEGSDGKVY